MQQKNNSWNSLQNATHTVVMLLQYDLFIVEYKA